MKKPELKKEFEKLKTENKKLKALLANAVLLLNKYKEFLRHPEKLGAAPKRKVAANKKKKTG
ncbi:MAG TPA: hypothetical protein VMQ54_09315 [Steroidobacteraceae bacterium]|nr:hypothetical protein [Steroidobacteraceae bacterium]